MAAEESAIELGSNLVLFCFTFVRRYLPIQALLCFDPGFKRMFNGLNFRHGIGKFGQPAMAGETKGHCGKSLCHRRRVDNSQISDCRDQLGRARQPAPNMTA